MIFKQLPTMISDLNKLGIALKSLDAMKIGTVGVDAANIEAYRTALKGLSVEQSVFALASKGATEEQIRQILVTNQATASEVEAAMAKAGLTTATKALTQAEMVEMATKNGVAKAEAEYEHKLKQIDKKDEQFDLDLSKLETERTALTTEYDSIKKVIEDNIERTFGIFS